jgi:hypothetical protein
MGTGGFATPSCVPPTFGDDGALSREGNTDIMGCLATYPSSFLTYDPSAPDGAFAEDVTCIATMGVGGCGWEQPLEAALKAITPSTQEPVGAFDGTFFMGTVGHGDGVNAGFLRPDSVLAVVIVTDEEDCSVADPRLFDDSSDDVYPGDLDLRCLLHDERAVHRIGRYVDGLLAQRRSPELFVFGVIGGVPTEAAPPPGVFPDYDAILAHPDMQAAIDPDDPTILLRSCDVTGRGLAFPPRRLVEVARDLHDRGATGVVQSICQADFTGPTNAILHAIAGALRATCLPREIAAADGRVACDVVETLPVGTSCSALPGRERIGVDQATRGEVCRIAQVPASGGVVSSTPGWYYDDFSPETRARCARAASGGQRIAFTPGSEPPVGARVRLECPMACR